MQTLFDDLRLTQNEAIAMTIENLNTYAKRYRHWSISYSGGKDSSATVTLICYLIESGQIPKPESLTILYADTGMELPPLHITAMKLLKHLGDRGYNTQIVKPKLDDRFFVYMFGRGVPAPKSGFRWCVGNLKIEPMQKHLNTMRETLGEKFLGLLGVRVGESAARDDRIAMSCSTNGAECSQSQMLNEVQKKSGITSYFVPTPESQPADILCPIVHWRVCQVWDWLVYADIELGFPTYEIAEAYGGNEKDEINARTGCVGCNVASKDVALENIVRLYPEKWGYLKPLLGLRPIYQELQKPQHRHRKPAGESNKDGSLVSNQNRLGPYTMKARKFGLEQILKIEADVNREALKLQRPLITLIDAEELERIYWHWENNIYPQKWDGSEPTGDVWQPQSFANGAVQNYLFNL